jgi:hypothetical protein
LSGCFSINEKALKGTTMDRLIILALAIVIAGALSGASGGLYSVAGTGTGTSIIINRFTAKAWTCSILFCEPMAFRNSK